MGSYPSLRKLEWPHRAHLGEQHRMRYGLPPFLRLRPRPAGVYGAACAQAMVGNWTATADCFHQLLEGFRRENGCVSAALGEHFLAEKRVRPGVRERVA